MQSFRQMVFLNVLLLFLFRFIEFNVTFCIVTQTINKAVHIQAWYGSEDQLINN